MSRPWEAAAGTRVWEQPQGLYPRTISITRPVEATATGLVGYQGLSETTETTLATGIPANIELASSGRNTSANGLPTSAPGPIKWRITVPASAAAGLPLIVESDAIYDDLGRRYRVDGYEPNPLGALIDVVRLTA